MRIVLFSVQIDLDRIYLNTVLQFNDKYRLCR